MIGMIAARFRKYLRARLSPALLSFRAGRVRACRPQGAAEARLYAFGSSSCELFDYIFGTSSQYRSHWASGWSARGFLKAENRNYVLACLKGASSDDIIFLQYGNVDVQFNAAHRMRLGDFLDPAGFCAEAAEGLLKMAADLRTAGFSRVYCIYAGPPVPLPVRYYRKGFGLPAVPARFQAQMFREINRLLAGRVALVDMSDVLADEHGLLKEPFRRPFPDHHADYTRIQEPVWARIRDIPGIPPRRAEWRSQLYPHCPRGISKLISGADLRPTDIVAREALGLHPKLRGRSRPDASEREMTGLPA
ncbi:hypothetical protein [Leisingera sp. NJS204]|uniref:hypothetical protein n=1 Tax=Leisingera sp. NJS204 TaxID=2508307 RepID=UPI0013E8FC61|nr:hypothetical protein [Leisingera sp. NJS204]